MRYFSMTKILFALLVAFAISGCAETRAEKGALIGAGGGALLGQAIGGNTKSTLIGAAVGGVTGALIGDYQDKQHPDRKYYRDQNGHTYYIGNDGRAYYVD
jgi:uncharacterized membrane protein